MKIKCISNKISSQSHNSNVLEWAKNSELEITIGKIYTVLAISKYMDVFFYYVLGDETDNYPLAFPEELFVVIEKSISKFWDTPFKIIDSLEEFEISNNDIISFKDWKIKKDTFYENLLNEMKSEVEIFNYYRDRIIDEDYPR